MNREGWVEAHRKQQSPSAAHHLFCYDVRLTFPGGLNISRTSGRCWRLRRRSNVWCSDATRRSTAAACVLVRVDRNTALSSSCQPTRIRREATGGALTYILSSTLLFYTLSSVNIQKCSTEDKWLTPGPDHLLPANRQTVVLALPLQATPPPALLLKEKTPGHTGNSQGTKLLLLLYYILNDGPVAPPYKMKIRL